MWRRKSLCRETHKWTSNLLSFLYVKFDNAQLRGGYLVKMVDPLLQYLLQLL